MPPSIMHRGIDITAMPLIIGFGSRSICQADAILRVIVAERH